MRTLITGVFILLLISSLAGQQSEEIVIGNIKTLHSNILEEDRTVWIHVPDENTEGRDEELSYPVVYLLDGDAHFHSVVGMLKQMSSNSRNAKCPKMIVVGIPNTNRTRDLTPSQATEGPSWLDSTMMSISGGGDRFLSFIESELIPYIESNYATQPYRMFIGHSFGGLTVMNTLISRPHLFNAYVAIDPSMWWDGRKLLHQIEQFEFDRKYQDKALFIGIANTMSPGMDTLQVQNDTTESTDHIRGILKLNSIFKNEPNQYLSYAAKYYEDDNHGTVPLITEYDAIHHIFDFFRLNLTQQDILDPEVDLMSRIEEHFNRLSREFGGDLRPEESLINNIGYQLLGDKQYDRAEQFFLMNVQNYPNNDNPYDSLGDLYLETDRRTLAIENFNKSVELNENSVSREKLMTLLKK